ncbi:MAG TPA: hypothetical protein VF796_19610 [Humisphaera sp.]
MSLPRFAAMLLLPLASVATLAVGGCQSGSAPAPAAAAAAAPDRVLMTPKATFVLLPASHGQGGVTAYTRQGEEPCPECMATAQKYLSTGVLDHTTCKTCGATYTVGQGVVRGR